MYCVFNFVSLEGNFQKTAPDNRSGPGWPDQTIFADFANTRSMLSFYRNRGFLSFLLILTVFFPACRVDPDEQPEIIVTADPEFTVDLFEQRDAADGHPTFGLLVESVKTYDVAGYRLDAGVQVSPGRIEVKFIGVQAPSDSLGDATPLRQFVPVGPLSDGEYEFILDVGTAITNRGKLNVQQGVYALSIEDPQGIDFQNRVMRTIPAGLIWGFARTPDEPSVQPALSFLDALKPISAEPGLEPGFYSYFTVAGSGHIFFHPSFTAGPPDAQIFVRRLTAPRADLQAVLQSFRSTPVHPLEIRCWTTEGEM
jgi:hypothetical protein